MNQNVYGTNSANQEDIEAVNVLVREIVKAIRGKAINCDRTYKTVIKRIDKKGYVILDETGSERTVPCCIPGITLRVGQMILVKEPMGQLKDLHICGIVSK